MLTDRDKEVIINIGKHKALSQQQIQKLHFKSYATCQRRFRRELVTNDYISEPFYWNVGKWGKVPLYRLKTKGKKIYTEFTGEDYNKPTWSENYIPHLLKTNDILVELNDIINNLWLEFTSARESKVQLDSLIELKSNNKRVAIEIDLGSESKKQVQQQYLNYQSELDRYNLPSRLIFFSNRAEKIYKWCLEVASKNLRLKPSFISFEKVNQIKSKLGRG